MRKGIVWLPRTHFPLCVGFCPSEAAWRRDRGRLCQADYEYPQTDAHVLRLGDHPSLLDTCIIFVNARLDSYTEPVDIVGLITHEVMHVWQWACRMSGETSPGEECAAYFVQFYTAHTLRAYIKERDPIAFRKVKPDEERRAQGNA